jgi:hypothetical protein
MTQELVDKYLVQPLERLQSFGMRSFAEASKDRKEIDERGSPVEPELRQLGPHDHRVLVGGDFLLHGPADDETSALPIVASLARVLANCPNLLHLTIPVTGPFSKGFEVESSIVLTSFNRWAPAPPTGSRPGDEEAENAEEEEGEDSDATPARTAPLLHGPADDETSTGGPRRLRPGRGRRSHPSLWRRRG